MSNPYKKMVDGYIHLMKEGKDLPLGGFSGEGRPAIEADAKKVLIFSPHPDDESIVGALALRMLRELCMNVINVAVTQGSNKERQAGRFEELTQACNFLGFGLIQTRENGLEGVNPKTREKEQKRWAESVKIIQAILEEEKPDILFIPHIKDWNSTHMGTHLLVLDALKEIGPSFSCLIVENEFWGAMEKPNLMIETSAKDTADLIGAISFHAGEVRRNPYHLRLPAWMQDNVRRGGEIVGGQGAAVPDFEFCTLYRLLKWTGEKLELPFEGGKMFSCQDDLNALFSLFF